MTYANSKGADQFAHVCSLNSAFVVRCLDSNVDRTSVELMSHLRKKDKVNKVEKLQKLTAGLNPNHMHIFKPCKTKMCKVA